MSVLKRTVVVGAVLACGAFGMSAQQQRKVPTQADLQGAWRLVSLEMGGQPRKAEGFMFFAGNHLGFITTRERPDLPPELNSKPVDQLTDAEKALFVHAYRNMTSAAGPYTIEGDEISFTVQVSRQPRLPTRPEKRKSWIEGDRLTQDFVGGSGDRIVFVWERVK